MVTEMVDFEAEVKRLSPGSVLVQMFCRATTCAMILEKKHFSIV